MIATVAHEDQTDKNGAPYISHPAAVASYVTTDDEKAVAWLHDVIEDTAVTAEHLLELGFPQRIVSAVVLLTRTKEVSSDDYYAAIRKNPLALTVKNADVKHNTSPDRLALLPKDTQTRLTKKYRKALTLLNG
jgi:(p)ppGpp synthase/HD superfamily hydrolase